MDSPPTSADSGSRWNGGRRLERGARVMVRRHLRDGESSHLLTDVLGTVTSLPPHLVVRTKDGREVPIPDEDIAVLKVLPPRPVLVREVRQLTWATALGWPGTKHELVDGWLCRAGDGWSYRHAAAVPVQPWAMDTDLSCLLTWYRAHSQPLWLEIPSRLASVDRLRLEGRPLDAGLVHEIEVSDTGELEVRTAEIEALRTLAASAAGVQLDAIELRDSPSPEFLAAYHATSDLPAEHVLPALTAAAGGVAFAELRLDGKLAAFARGSLSAAPQGPLTLGISCVETTAEFRRRGLARDVVAALAEWGAAHGATRAQLHVFVHNTAGMALWDELGFVEHHRTRHVPLLLP